MQNYTYIIDRKKYTIESIYLPSEANYIATDAGRHYIMHQQPTFVPNQLSLKIRLFFR